MRESLDPEEVVPPVEIVQASVVGPPPALTAEFIEHVGRLIETNVEYGLRAQIARRSNLPFSEVAERWSMEDLAVELAMSRREIDDARHRCPTCGIDSRDQLTGPEPWAKLGSNIAWRLEIRQCDWCEEKDELQAKLANKTYKRPPPHVHYVPALPGEPFFDESQMPRRVVDEGPPGAPREPPGEPLASDPVEG